MEDIVFWAPVKENENPVFEVIIAGITYPDPDYEIYRRCSELYVAEYVAEGEGTVFCNGVEYNIKAGDAYILPAGVEHKYYSKRSNPWKKKWMNISGELCESLIKAYGLKDKICFSDTAAEPLFDEFLNFCKKTADANEINRKGAIVFHRILQSLVNREEKKVQSTVQKAKLFIDSKIYERLTAQTVARTVGLSVSQLGRLFKNEYDCTVYTYILNRKIETAENLLKNTVLPIKQISEMLSFTDEHYFSNIFKNKKGLTPGKYRKGY